jgi:hypothetical protein
MVLRLKSIRARQLLVSWFQLAMTWLFPDDHTRKPENLTALSLLSRIEELERKVEWIQNNHAPGYYKEKR